MPSRGLYCAVIQVNPHIIVTESKVNCRTLVSLRTCISSLEYFQHDCFMAAAPKILGISGNSVDLYPEVSRTESQMRHQISWLRILKGFPQFLQGNSRVVT